MLGRIIKVVLSGSLVVSLLLAAVFLRPDLSREDLQQYAFEYADLPSGAVAHYQDIGGRDKPVIILIHGQTAALDDWELWMEPLAKEYRVIRVDMPGHGLTGRIPSDIYNRGSMSKFLHEFVNALEIERFSLAGHSMGGGVSLLYTLEHPERVESLILVASGGLIPEGGWSEEQKAAIDLEQYVIVKPLLRYFATPGFLSDSSAAALYVNPSNVPEALQERMAVTGRHDFNRWAMYKDHEDFFTEDLFNRLDEVNTPTLVIHAMEDPLVPYRNSERFYENIRDSELKTYEGSGHMPMIDRPQATVADVLEFLNRRRQ